MAHGAAASPASQVSQFPASDWIDRQDAGKAPIILTKSEYGIPAGTKIRPPVTQPNCNQPTAAARAADLAGTLTKAQAQYYGLPLRSEFAKDANGTTQFKLYVTHDLQRDCTYIPTFQTHPATPGGTKITTPSKLAPVNGHPLPRNLQYPTGWDCVQTFPSDGAGCWAGYVSDNSQTGQS